MVPSRTEVIYCKYSCAVSALVVNCVFRLSSGNFIWLAKDLRHSQMREGDVLIEVWSHDNMSVEISNPITKYRHKVN